jgi:hypothetical protein
MIKMTKDQQQKTLLVAGITVGTAVLLWFAMISPLRAKLERMIKQTQEAKLMVEQGHRSIAAAPQLSNALARASAQIQTAEGLMAAGDLYEWVIQEVNRFKTAHAIDIPQISRETPCEVGFLPRFPYRAASFAVRGSAYYQDLGQFLASFENSHPFLHLQSLQLGADNSAAKKEANERLQFSVELVTLVKPVMP